MPPLELRWNRNFRIADLQQVPGIASGPLLKLTLPFSVLPSWISCPLPFPIQCRPCWWFLWLLMMLLVLVTVVLQLRLSIVELLLQVSLWNVRLLLLGLP